MVQAKCIKKLKDKHGKIICYTLIDFNGQTQEVSADILKKAIRSGDINVVNLSLTRDGRLISKSEDGLKSSKLVGTNNKISKECIDLAKAIVYMDQQCMTLGETYTDTVSMYCDKAGIEFDDYRAMNDSEYEYAVAVKAVSIMIANHTFDSKALVDYLMFNEILLINRLNDNMLKYIQDILKYAEKDNLDANRLKHLRVLYNKFKNYSGTAIKLAVSIGNEWWRYLDEECYGVMTNAIARVGRITTKADVASNIGEFVCFADFNSLALPNFSGYAVGMTNEGNGLLCKIYLFNEKRKNRYYHLYNDSFTDSKISRFYSLDTDAKEAAKELASIVNKLAFEKLKKIS